MYSASETAKAEFPDLTPAQIGAISIARRLQDPLSELLKIDPKAIGVGLYQHDLAPKVLDQHVAEVVEDCVNLIGVDVNVRLRRGGTGCCAKDRLICDSFAFQQYDSFTPSTHESCSHCNCNTCKG